MPTTTIDAPAWVVPNLIWNATSFGIRILIALWFVPYLVHHLGAAVYGLIPLATTATAYLTIATGAISSAISRDLISSLTRRDDLHANRTFNTAFFGLLGLSLLLTIPLAIVSLRVDFFLNVPAGLEESASELFAWIGGAFLLTTIASPFAASAIAKHRLDLSNGITIAENILRVGIVVSVFSLVTPDVSHVGIGTIAGTAIAGILSFVLWKILTPELSVRWKDFNSKTLGGLTKTGSWAAVGQVGTLLLVGIDLILANRFYGAELGGHYALALQWAMLLRAMATTIAGTFTPTIAALYAENNPGRVQRMLSRSIKAVALFMAIPIGLVCGFAEPLLRTWLGSGFTDLSPLMILMVASLIFNVPFTPVFALALAADRVRGYAITTLFLGFANPLLSWFLAKPCGWGLYGIAASSTILLAGRSLLYETQFASRILSQCCKGSLLDVATAIVFGALIALAGFGMSIWMQPDSWFLLGLAAMPVTLIFGGGAWFILLNPAERSQLRPGGRR